MPEGIENGGAVEPGFEGPPDYFGLRWGPPRIVVTRRGERQLSRATNVTRAFERAWNIAPDEFSEAGYAWERGSVLFWERRDLDRASLQRLIDSLPERAAQAQVEAARLEQERRERQAREQAEREERERVYIEAARVAARVSLRERRWSWAKAALVAEAEELLARPDLDRSDAVRLLDLVDQAGRNVARSEQRTAVAHEPEMARAEDPEIQAAALAGVRHVTGFDADWASLQNGVGWSKATTCDGHVLAGLDRLTVEQTSHALRLLRVHQRQLPPRLILALFAPRGPAPEQATLSLSPAA
ncbi:hypothetical protein LPC10_08395 [Methylorubrum sp. B1-46]|uniref:hypothetical protein n=1 Tax=Methylorubrum sp. B1-46 TaxID=2897334 RepID=UPI001E4B9BD8|nr:hypothetical protein [Methylorubrum sp. B1-46]UGB27568.1 hypothetical protein LPC10_08395 [Methylorubrum sp. B1-46]